MKFYIRKKKKTDECECAPSAAPFTPVPDGMGPVIPGVSGDRFDTILGTPNVNAVPHPLTKRKYKVKHKRKSK